MNAGSSLLACYATGNVTSTGSSTGNVHIFGLLGDNLSLIHIWEEVKGDDVNADL